MAFISDASNFTLGEGVYNNVHGNFVVHNVHNHVYGQKRRREEINGRDVPLLEGSSNKRRREDSGEEGFEIILAKHLKLTREIGNGPEYFLHAGEHQGRALILKVFNPGPSARQRMESTVALSQGLMHPNVLRIEGISSPTSPTQFIAYENVYWLNAAGPLAIALKEDVPRSIVLGFRMIAGLASGINHLKVNAISLSPMTVENFDIFLDVNDRFLISIDAGSSEGTTSGKFSRAAKDDHGWDLLNLLCQKMFKSANRALHNQEIERHPETLDHLLRQRSNPSSSSAPLFCTSDQCSEGTPQLIPDEQLLPPRREYVWRTLERGKSCLTTVAAQITLDLEMKLSTLIRVALQDTESPHRCRGYVREEITLTTVPAESAVVSHDAPSPLEICPVCCEVVGFHEMLNCICGDPNPGSRYTVKCRVCKFWSHIDCVGNPQHFTCESCPPWNPEAAQFMSRRANDTAVYLGGIAAQMAAAQPSEPKRQRVPEHEIATKNEKDDGEIAEEGSACPKPPGACARCKNFKVKCEFKSEVGPCKRCFNVGHDCVTMQPENDAMEEEGGAHAMPKAMPYRGVCVRCKNLKVKCESKTETDPCKRCFNGGHDCVIPGRKKRRHAPSRTPPTCRRRSCPGVDGDYIYIISVS